MTCKPTLSDLNRSIDFLYEQFYTKENQDYQEPPRQRRETEPKRYVFLRGEVLLFGNMTSQEVISTLGRMHVEVDQVQLTYDGDPIFFSAGADRDNEGVPPYFLKHSDLPYGFAGPGGLFQFSSPELTLLRRSVNPQTLDSGYMYMGTDWESVSYEDISSPDTLSHYCPMMYGLGWTWGSSTPEHLNYIAEGKYNNVSLQNIDYTTIRYDFTTKDAFIRAINDSQYNATWPSALIKGDINYSNYDPGTYLGWRYYNLLQTTSSSKNLQIRRPILTMPPRQLKSFKINPEGQVPYKGAEGCYPVILVEFTKDVYVVIK